MAKSITPLIQNDLQMYDTTPDGRIFLKEFGEMLDSFVERYIHTDDRNVRNVFRSAMENSAWEAVRAAILKISKGDIEDNTLKERLAYILTYEFPDKMVSGDFNTEFELDEEQEKSDQDEDNYELQKSTNVYRIIQNFGLRAPLNTSWLLTGSAAITTSRNDQRQTEYAGANETSTDHSFLGTISSGSIGIQKRDDSFKSYIGGSWTQNYQKLPLDQLETSGNAFGGFELNNVWDAFSLRGNVDYKKEKYSAPPADSGFFQNSTNSLSISSEAAYLFKPFGIVVDHSFKDADMADHYSEERSSTNSLSALAQYTWEKSYLQAGAGYSIWETESRFINDEKPLSYDGDAVYGTAKGQYQISDRIRLDGGGTLNINRSEGTFEGRYPSWSTNLALSWTPDKWMVSAFLSYSGQDIDLNNSQTKHTVEEGADITYRPSDSVKVSVSPSIKNSVTEGKDAYTNDVYKIKSSLSYNIIGSVWLWTFAGGYLYRYQDEESSLAGHGWWTGGGAGINY